MTNIKKIKLTRKHLATAIAKKEIKHQQLAKVRRQYATLEQEHSQSDIPPATNNQLADMAWALHRCFQCGEPQTEGQIESIKKIRSPGAVVICEECCELISKHNAGETVMLSLVPFATTPECQEEFRKLSELPVYE
jgi:hypothetical protein